MLKREFPTLQYHLWISFIDANGYGACEPEAIVEFEDFILLFEAKLTGGPAGQAQMLHLYRPVLEWIYHKPVRSLLVCKWVTPATPGPFFSSPEAFLDAGVEFGTWHWIET